VLGIGIGGIQDLEQAGILIQKPVTEMRKATSILRELLSGTDVTEDTELTRLKNYRLRLQDDAPVPIFYGVRGPKMLALAGRLADGVILSGPFDYLVEAVKIVNTAAKKSGREPESIGKVVWLPTIPTFRGMKEKTARKIVTLILADTPDAVINMLNLDKEELLYIRDSVSIGGVEAGVDLITDEILEAFSISGSKDHMVDRFDRIADIGATELVIGPPYSGEWKAAIRELISEIQSRRDSE
jgi:5,10-methylenetetrahydromethanopterin reductase